MSAPEPPVAVLTPEPTPASVEARLQAHLTLWEKAVDVQQHFNDIGWRIRALALTVLTFTFGATGFAYANTDTFAFDGRHVSPAFAVPLLGLAIWIAFWFADAGWYHKLLVGAVKEGIAQEKLLKAFGVEAGLGKKIGDESPISPHWPRWPWRKRAGAVRRPITWRAAEVKLHSKHKLNLFYGGICALLITATWVLFFLPARAVVPEPAPEINITNVIPIPTTPPHPIPAR
ncbi:hypothetical protein [Microbacterium terrisoli]|uniref:hypothetical protein n=1 Tax=Microbacterium terrisoli TaxID=3242192 RepID=UPI00280567A8|nr:hypothetical protein [Microbacterium protaetiae]